MPAILISLLAAVAGAVLWQHLRYLRTRRDRVEDRQALFYWSTPFHAVALLKLPAAEGRSGELAALGALRDAIQVPGGGQVVYAGLVGLTMAPSQQLENDWSAVLFAEYPSQDAFEQNRKSPAWEELRARCERSHLSGFRRPAILNLLIPLALGVMHLRSIVLRKPRILPFTPVPESDAIPELQMKLKEMDVLNDYRELRDDAVVIVNWLLPGTAEQRAADRAYGGEMMRGMAEGGYGPMHMGPAVDLEGDSHFRQFAAVYYPGIDHMQAMVGSGFMNGIARGKQLGDTLAVATIPVLSKLPARGASA